MKCGDNNLELSFNFNFQFSKENFSHFDDNCAGESKIVIAKNEPYYLDQKIAFLLPFVVKMHCEKCGSTIIPQEHREDIEKMLVSLILINNKVLHPYLLKFLRKYFAMSQAEVSEAINISDRQYRKFEDEKSGLRIQINDLTLLKMYYLEKLNIVEKSSFKQVFESLFMSKEAQELITTSISAPERLFKPIKEYADSHKIEELKRA